MDVINEIDGLENRVTELEAQAKVLDEVSLALETKVNNTRQEILKNKE